MRSRAVKITNQLNLSNRNRCSDRACASPSWLCGRTMNYHKSLPTLSNGRLIPIFGRRDTPSSREFIKVWIFNENSVSRHRSFARIQSPSVTCKTAALVVYSLCSLKLSLVPLLLLSMKTVPCMSSKVKKFEGWFRLPIRLSTTVREFSTVCPRNGLRYRFIGPKCSLYGSWHAYIEQPLGCVW
uniref:Uncharacterized protein n=1 Tax=Schistocephalus solidus TaxID=70667 RepID=A0A0X3PHB6_SCHSO